MDPSIVEPTTPGQPKEQEPLIDWGLPDVPRNDDFNPRQGE
jgi:hypothetical protein